MNEAKSNREKYAELKKANPKITQKEAAKALGVTPARISQFEAKMRDSTPNSKPLAPSPDIKEPNQSVSSTAGQSPIISVTEAPVLSEAQEIQSEFAKHSDTGQLSNIGPEPPAEKGKRQLDLGDLATTLGSVVSFNLAKRGYSEFTSGEIENIKTKAVGLSGLLPNIDARAAAGIEFAGALVAPIAKRIVTEKPVKVRGAPGTEGKEKTETATEKKAIEPLAETGGSKPSFTGPLTIEEKIAAAQKRYVEKVQTGG